MSANSPQFRPKVPTIAPSLAANEPYHVDLNLSVTAQTSQAEPLLLYNSDCKKQCIETVLEVLQGEEHYEPGLGSRITEQVFAPMNRQTAYRVEGYTISAITTQMRGEIILLAPNTFVEANRLEEYYAVQVLFKDVVGGPVQRHSFNLSRPGSGNNSRSSIKELQNG